MREGWALDVPMRTLCSIDSGSSNAQDAVDDAPYVLFDRSKQIKRSTRYLFDCEALIIPGEGTEFLPRHFVGKFDLHQRAYALHDFSERIDVKYLYYYLIYLKDYFPRVAVGATVKSLRRRHFENLPVTVAPLSEQQRIVAILDDAFAGLATANANAEKNLKNARELFERDLNSTFTKSSWKKVPLAKILSSQPRNGWSPPAQFQTGTGYPVLMLSAVTGFQYDGTRVKLSSAPTRDGAHYWLEPGELLITRSNTQELVGHVAIYDGTPERAICCDLIMKMKVDPSKVFTRFVYYYLRSREARAYFTGRAHGASSTMKKISKQMVQDILVPLPSLTEQDLTMTRLDKLTEMTDRLSELTQQKLHSIWGLKRSILQKAFSGELTSPPSQAIKEAAE